MIIKEAAEVVVKVPRFDYAIICACATFTVPFSIAIIGRSAVKAIAANPEAKEVFVLAIIAMAFCESVVLFCFGFVSLIK